MGLIIGIDGSRTRSGGGRAHLIGILSECDPATHGIREVHVWAFRELLDQLPDETWLIKHNPEALGKSLFRQLMWQATELTPELKSTNCDVLFTTGASTLCRFKRVVAISQDLLPYEPNAMQRFGYGFFRCRLIAILALQNLTFRRARGVIFLTRYSGRIVQKSCGQLSTTAYIPHGFDNAFNLAKIQDSWPSQGERPVRCIYVSHTEMYKHQWIVVEAIALLRACGHNLSLSLVGGGNEGSAQTLLDDTINDVQDGQIFVEQLGSVPNSELPELLAQADIFIFASSCENMPVTLIEGMAIGLPIACSNRGPMPEVLEDGGIYFDPEDAESIAEAVEKIIQSADMRLSIACKAQLLSKQYNWKRCSNETFSFIRSVSTGEEY